MGIKFSRAIIAIVFLLGVSFSFSQNGEKGRDVESGGVALPEISISDNKLTLRNAPVGKQVVIYTIIGNKVRQIEIKSPNEEHELKLLRAIYIIKLEGIVKKFVIR
ncbi:MAG: hypothetical protein LBF79_04240 [Dysgonamonadaceae bacterium]|jgi:hypothetical protein|nr:hypothetical protein [Dysgonamonadaceae bacterium]